ncbi:2-(1,2-epoxy-1,2-dihydrophenyl)acetyl-CoA isomerase [Pseudomaricurvus alkylphenolicus]|uniref:enoyl-CoA hydratase-related protein n=1 Tax=Pseudomaricurvus alkylphenolicus TaxID=1306991 RepID=UPI00141EE74D|nr:enoyl-CoA hydratase-related protein [Pseudomaricurvus alkylphenolicus]NIB43474.1 2-(1,2-epoxy-1,2-dihydrophenyl)acetyl-CoA isomerase [Pseudomaricurvus alkylphenolicus]
MPYDHNYETIDFRIEEDVATIVLTRPKRFNSFTEQMHIELKSVLKRISADRQLRCLVITGSGQGFCTGQDLNDRYQSVAQENANLGASLEKHYNPLVRSLKSLDIPVICAVNGVAAGAGVSLALACDIVIAAQSASFVFAFSKVGLVPDAGATWSLVKAVGLPRANAMALMGESMPASEAQKIGLIWKCVADEDIETETASVVERLSSNPAQGLTLTKRALQKAADSEFHEQLTNEAHYQTLAGRNPDYKEAVCAFVEKRTPDFSHQFHVHWGE